MYEEFYGLERKPFSIAPDPSIVFLSHNHKKAKVMLEYGLMSHAGFTVVTGDVGVGKSTLVYYELSQLGEDTIVGVINNTHEGFGDILQWVCDAFDIECPMESRTKRLRAINEFISEKSEQGKRVLLVVDEAQNLSEDTIEELRLISNINIDSEIILQIILIGQPELIDKLNSPRLVQFAQRISVEYNLRPMSFDDTCEYIRFRLSHAGATYDIFDKIAMAAVFCFSEGIPRRINTLCDMALVYAFAQEKKIIDATVIVEVVKDRRASAIIRPVNTNNEEVFKVGRWLESQISGGLNDL